ncbi:MAG: transposase [Nostoc sp.]
MNWDRCRGVQWCIGVNLSQTSFPARGWKCYSYHDKRRAYGREFFVYAVYKVKLSLHQIHDDYRLRLGIESSYRMKNQCRIKTTIKNPTIRLATMG